ncbi:MAG: hypothetical protein WBE75_05560 [Candidatus Omnitrophota bacterium]
MNKYLCRRRGSGKRFYFLEFILLFGGFLQAVAVFLPGAVLAEDMTVTTYYPSPNGSYDALSVKRLSVGDTNADGSINASDVSASSGYLLVADRIGVGSTSPEDSIHIKSANYRLSVENSSDSDGINSVWGSFSSIGQVRNPGFTFAGGTLGLTNIMNSDFAFFGMTGSYDDSQAIINWGDDNNLLFAFNGTEVMRITNGGNVGVGTASPGSRMDVYYDLNTSGLRLTSPGYDTDSLNQGLKFHSTSDSGYQGDVVFYHRGSADPGLDIWGYPANGTPSCCVFIAHFSNNGNVGIGTASPQVKLAVNGSGTNVYATDAWIENNMHVQGNEALNQGGRGRMRVGTAWGYMGLYADVSSTGAANDLVLGAGSGQVRVGSDGSGQKLKVASRAGTYGYSPDDVPSGWGGGLTTWDVCSRASIRYTSSISGGGWDLAEEYESKDTTLKPGEIVSIDHKNDNSVARTDKPVDAAMLGVVSTRPSVLMGVEWDDPKYGNLPIAIIGRVPARVMFIEGEHIERGEMLTSSFLPGYAMKIAGPGMIVGKTLQAVDQASIANAPAVKSLSSIKWPDDDGSNKAKPLFRVPADSLGRRERAALSAAYPGYSGKYVYVGKVMLFVGVYYFAPDAASLEKRVEALEKKFKQ